MQTQALLVDTCDRPADDPLQRILGEFRRNLLAMSPEDRRDYAKTAQARIQDTLSKLGSNNPRLQAEAGRTLHLNGIDAMSASVLPEWLQRVIKTGEVPA